MRQEYLSTTILILCVAASISLSAASAETQVTIPLGASISSNPFSLSPSVLNVKANDTVTWKNQDVTIHTVTTGKPQLGWDGRIDSGPIASGQSFSYNFDKVGVYQYFCLIHPWMTGLVNVGDGTQVDPKVEISISTDKPSYNKGDTILISGQVSRFVPNEQVTVWITDELGKGIVENHIETEAGNKFSTTIVPEGNLWIPGNTYKVFAQYGFRSSVAWATIGFEPKNALIETDQNKAQISTASSVTMAVGSEGKTSYFTEHKKIIADSNEFVTVQTQQHIYSPGEQVKIYGSIWDGMFQHVGGAAYLATIPVSGLSGTSITELVSLQISDANGNLVSHQQVPVGSDGDYTATFNLPQDVSNGAYTIQAQIEAKSGLLNTLDISTTEKLGASTKFVVANTEQFVVKTSSGDLNVEIGSNSTVSNFKFKSEQKEVSFTVQGETGTKGVTLVTIPKDVISGQLQVFIDGNIQPYNSDNVIITSDTSEETTLELSYHHSTHTIEVVGTQSAQTAVGTETVPEFPISSMIMTVAIISSVTILATFGNKLARR